MTQARLEGSAADGQAPTPRMSRRAKGRVVAGVCAGLADHLGLDVLVVRTAFVLLGIVGAGIAAYLALWLLVPRADQDARDRNWVQLGAYLLLAVGLGLIATLFGRAPSFALVPIVFGGLGAAILWQQANPDRRAQWRLATTAQLRRRWIQSAAGLLLVVAGVVGFLAWRGQLAAARQGLVATGVILLGVGIIAAPLLLRLYGDLDRERSARIRSQERAELAAQVHDSVLHTLTLIYRKADDPREVQRLARAQERELRSWLYQTRADPNATLAAAVSRIAADVEDAHSVPIEVVCVGDCPLDEPLTGMLQAAREAMVNSAKYSGAPSVSVFAEVEKEQVEIFVRDRGKGFTMAEIPADRLGVRQSIIGRMERNGGTAEVRSAPGEGTEVRLMLRRERT